MTEEQKALVRSYFRRQGPGAIPKLLDFACLDDSEREAALIEIAGKASETVNARIAALDAERESLTGVAKTAEAVVAPAAFVKR